MWNYLRYMLNIEKLYITGYKTKGTTFSDKEAKWKITGNNKKLGNKRKEPETNPK